MDDRAKRFLDAALDRGWITSEQVEECRRIQQTVAEVGVEQSVEEILVKKGYLSADQARQIRRELSATQVGKYHILERLGEGGAGIVYKANQETLERVVAIKVLSKRRVSSEKYLERFAREARIAVTLNHQNIVRGLDYGEADGYHYFVMEYVEGDSLYQVLQREGTLAEKRAVEIVLQIVSALKHAAKYELVHRDIKPENILITPDGVAKLCDLGLAKPSLVEASRAAKGGVTIGTPTYMSPEQIRGKDDTDFRSDIYSLGATLYHMVTGEPPFVGASADVVVRKHLREEVTDPRERNPVLSSSIASVIMKMLAKQPEERYASLDDLAEDLQATLDGRPPTHAIRIGARRPAAPAHVSIEEAGPRRARRHEGRKKKSAAVPLFIVGGAAVVLAVLALALGLLSGPGPKKGVANAQAATRKTEKTTKQNESTPEDKADRALAEVQSDLDAHPELTADQRKSRLKTVVAGYPGTAAASSASAEIEKIEQEEKEAAKEHLASAKSAYDERERNAEDKVKANDFGAAVSLMRNYPHEFSDTEYAKKARQAVTKFLGEAKTAVGVALSKADSLMTSGRYAKAESALKPFAGIEIPAEHKAVAAKLAAIRQAKQQEAEAKKRSYPAFQRAVGKAFDKAAEGRYSEAGDDLVKASGQSDLVYYGAELNAVWKDIREMKRFEGAMVAGAQALKGHSERFSLLDSSESAIEGTVTSASNDGVTVKTSRGSRSISFSELSGIDRIRIAFHKLDVGNVDDHRAAALYLIAHNLPGIAAQEIKEVGKLGADTTELDARRTLYMGYLKHQVDAEVASADVYVASQRWGDAKDLLEKAIRRAPWYGSARFHLGRLLAKERSYSKALDDLLLAKKLGTQDPDLDYYVGVCYDELAKPAKALEALVHFKKEAPKDSELLKGAESRIDRIKRLEIGGKVKKLVANARRAFYRKEWKKATAMFERVHELEPQLTEALYYLGRCYQQQGHYLRAYASYETYLKASGGHQTHLTDVRQRVHDLERTRKNTSAAVAVLRDAEAKYKAGQFKAALSLYSRAVVLVPLNKNAWYGRALSRERIGENTQVVADFEASMKDLESDALLEPDSARLVECRCLCEYYLDKKDAALKDARTVIAKAPDRWQAYNIAGLVNLERGKYKEAVQRFSGGLKSHPEIVVLYINRALAHESMKEYQKATADLQEAMKHKPTGPQLKAIGKIVKRLSK